MIIRKKILRTSFIFGNLAYYISKLIHFSLRIKYYKSEKYQNDKPCLFAFWHGKQFLPVLELVNHKTKKAALVSPSEDGNVLEYWLKKIGYEVERGSSRDNNIRSLIKMIKKLKTGYTLGFGIDGPIGPIYKVKPGMTYMAQKCNIPIIPLASAFSRKWIFKKSWDKYELPKPFAKAAYCIGDPFFVNKGDDLEESNVELEKKMYDLLKKAEMLLK